MLNKYSICFALHVSSGGMVTGGNNCFCLLLALDEIIRKAKRVGTVVLPVRMAQDEETPCSRKLITWRLCGCKVFRR